MNNLGLKILSVALAAILWIVITNVDDPIGSKDFDNVTVQIVNEDVITKLGKVYDIVQGETIDFTIEARRSVRDDLKASDFKVTADFSQLSDVYAVPIEITCPKYGDAVVVTYGKDQRMIVSLEELVSETFKVNIIQKGEAAEGYFVGAKVANPNIITVSGPKSRIERISEVAVEVDVTGASETFHSVGQPKVLDEDGKEMDVTYIDFNEDYVAINVDLYKKKEINLQISTTGNPADGYVMTGIEYEPKRIVVAGKEEDIRRIRYLSVKHDINGATADIAEEIDLQEKLPEGIILVGEDKTAVINIKIEKMDTKDITIWPGDIDFKNKSSSHSLYINTTGPMQVTVMGPEKELKDISRTTLKPFIDLAGFENGTYTESVKFDDLMVHSIVTISPEVNFDLAPLG